MEISHLLAELPLVKKSRMIRRLADQYRFVEARAGKEDLFSTLRLK